MVLPRAGIASDSFMILYHQSIQVWTYARAITSLNTQAIGKLRLVSRLVPTISYLHAGMAIYEALLVALQMDHLPTGLSLGTGVVTTW